MKRVSFSGDKRFLSASDAASMRRKYIEQFKDAVAGIIRQIEVKITELAKIGHEYLFWSAPETTTLTVEELIEAISRHFSKQGFFIDMAGKTLYISWRCASKTRVQNI
jgi:uncharacterized protein (DUF302 family)